MRITKDASERKNEILDVASRLFTLKGYEQTSTNDILQEVGIARGTLYYHFKSKEDILDAIIERLTIQLAEKAERIAENKELPPLQRLTLTIMAFNTEGDLATEVMQQVHKPQNALMHQKMQNRTLGLVNPVITKLIEECVEKGICQTEYPKETVKMITLYSNVAFDELSNTTDEEMRIKIEAFIYNLERLFKMESGALKEAIMPIFEKNQ